MMRIVKMGQHNSRVYIFPIGNNKRYQLCDKSKFGQNDQNDMRMYMGSNSRSEMISRNYHFVLTPRFFSFQESSILAP
jgi:hypothetical protein